MLTTVEYSNEDSVTGASRLAYHGIDRLVPGSSSLVRDDARINLTLRRVT